eukprot:3701560-Amphidinium_carterae.1
MFIAHRMDVRGCSSQSAAKQWSWGFSVQKGFGVADGYTRLLYLQGGLLRTNGLWFVKGALLMKGFVPISEVAGAVLKGFGL